MSNPPSVLFVCLGNICRSPLAEAALRDAAHTHSVPIDVDSAGTGNWHVGEPPDRRAQAVARANGCDIAGLRGRQVQREDFYRFDHVIALDHDNLRNLEAMRPEGSPASLSLLLDHVPGRRGEAVADPYFGDAGGFDETWSDVTQGAQAILRTLAQRS